MDAFGALRSARPALSLARPVAALREGASVFARVISKDAPASYTLSLAGARVSVTSQRELSPGSTFTATVKFQDGKILLVPSPETADGEAETVAKFWRPDVGADGKILDARLASYFESLALPPDELSLSLFRAMRALGMRFDGGAMKAARAAIKKFAGGDDEAADAALSLFQKGLPVDENSVEAVAGSGGRESPDERRNSPRENTEGATESEGREVSIESLKAEAKKFLSSIFGGTSSALGGKAGLLALFNHAGFGARGEKTWLRFPFALETSDGKQVRGSARFLIDKNLGTCARRAFTLDTGGRRYDFDISGGRGKLSARVKVSPCAQGEEKPLVENLRGKFLDSLSSEKNVSVEWADGADETIGVAWGRA